MTTTASNTQRSSFAALLQRHWDNPVLDRLAPFSYTITTQPYEDGTGDTYHDLTPPSDPADSVFESVATAVNTFNTNNPDVTISVDTTGESVRTKLGLYAAHQELVDWTDLYNTRQADNSPAIINLVGLAGGLNLQLEKLNLQGKPLPNGTLGLAPYIVAGTHTPEIERLSWVDTWASDMIGTIDKTFVDMDIHGYTNTATHYTAIRSSAAWTAYASAMTTLSDTVNLDLTTTTTPGGAMTPATRAEADAYEGALQSIVNSHNPQITAAVNAVKAATLLHWTVVNDHATKINTQIARERVWWNWPYGRTNSQPTKKSPATGSPFPDFTVIGLVSKAASLSQSLDTVRSNPDEATKTMFTEMHSHPGNTSAAAVIVGLAEVVNRQN